MNVQFITNEKGSKTGVFLTMKQYQKLLTDLEELEIIKAYDYAKKHSDETKTKKFDTFWQELQRS